MVVDSVEAQRSEARQGDAKMPGSVTIPVQIEALSGVVVDSLLLVELKAVSQIEPIYRVQLTTYLKLLKLPLGLLINFNVPLIKNGINRVLNLDLRS